MVVLNVGGVFDDGCCGDGDYSAVVLVVVAL